MKTIANRNILNIQPYVPGKPIEEVKRELGLKKVIKLASNENPYGPSPKVLAAIAREAKSLNRYPDGGCFELRKALSKHLKVPANQFVFGNGSDEIIVMAVKAFVSPGDEVIIAKPSFLIYEIAAKLAGAALKELPLKDFRYDLEGMLQAVTPKTKIIFVGNPDNPAGTYVTQRQVVDFLRRVPGNVLVFIDEAYFEYVTGKDYPDTLALLLHYPNLIVTRTFSKMYGLAGLRVGYGIANPEVIDLLNRVREPFNINSLAQVGAVACLSDQAYYRRVARLTKAERQSLYRHLRSMKVRFKESSTNFILIDVGNGPQVAQALLKKGIIVRDMAFWGLKDFIRVTIGTGQENKQFIQALKDVLKKGTL